MSMKVAKIRIAFAKRVKAANNWFNAMSKRRQQFAVLAFGVLITIVSVMLIVNSKQNKGATSSFAPDRIAMPYDIFMNNEMEVSESQLTPVGKMKGEIDGEFESFYVAVDSRGSIYINRDIVYSERAYEKTDDWKQISREKLTEYERDLHFIPSQSKGIRR